MGFDPLFSPLPIKTSRTFLMTNRSRRRSGFHCRAKGTNKLDVITHSKQVHMTMNETRPEPIGRLARFRSRPLRLRTLISTGPTPLCQQTLVETPDAHLGVLTTPHFFTFSLGLNLNLAHMVPGECCKATMKRSVFSLNLLLFACVCIARQVNVRLRAMWIGVVPDGECVSHFPFPQMHQAARQKNLFWPRCWSRESA